jgi:hypothetical protein
MNLAKTVTRRLLGLTAILGLFGARAKASTQIEEDTVLATIKAWSPPDVLESDLKKIVKIDFGDGVDHGYGKCSSRFDGVNIYYIEVMYHGNKVTMKYNEESIRLLGKGVKSKEVIIHSILRDLDFLFERGKAWAREHRNASFPDEYWKMMHEFNRELAKGFPKQA